MTDRFDASLGGWSRHEAASDELRTLAPERYRIDGLLGRGGMGEVYAAWDRHLEREVALKRTLHPGASEVLLDEARVAAQLDHIGIVPILDYGELPDGTRFYTMRRVQGRTLDEVPADPPQRVLAPLRDAVHAIAFAHARGILHRDLKPSNLMVTPFGETQVVDWGLACRASEARPGRLGTLRYLAEGPRQGEPMGFSDDVFALGATLVEVVTGRHADTPSGWRALAETLQPPALAAIARRALALEPDRYPDARALAEDLDAWFERRLVGAHAYSPLELARWLAWRLRRPLALVAVALLAAGGALFVTGREVLAERSRAWQAEAEASRAHQEADALLAESLAQQALEALEREALPEALVLATRALERADNPRARGVTMAVGPFSLPVVDVQRTGCEGTLHGTPSAWVCATGSGVHLPSGEPVFDGSVDAAAPTSSGTWVRTRRTIQHLPDGPVSDRAGLLALQGDRAAQVMRDEVRFLPATPEDARQTVRPCGDRRAMRTFAWSEQGLWIPCEGGTLVRLDGDRVDLRREGFGEEPITALAVQDAIWLARTDRIERYDLTGTPIDTLRPGVQVVRRLELDGAWALIEGDRGGPVLLHRTSGDTALELPSSWRGASLTQGMVVLAHQGAWHVLPLHALHTSTSIAPAGIASIARSPATGAVSAALGDGSVVTWDARGAPLGAPLLLHRGYVTKDLTYTPSGALYAANMQGEPYLLAADGPQRRGTRGNPCRRIYSLEETAWCLTYTLSSPISVGLIEPSPGPAAMYVDAGGAPSRVGLLDDTGGVWIHDENGLRALGHPLGTEAIRVAAPREGPLIVGSSDHLAWVSAEGEVLDRVETEGALRSLDVSSDARWIAVGLLDGTGRLYRQHDDRLQLHASLEGVHEERISTVFVDEEGVVVTGGWDGRVHTWRPATTSPARAEDLERRWAIPLETLLEQ